MPEGGKEISRVERIYLLLAEGFKSTQFAGSLIQKLAESGEASHRYTEMMDCLPCSSGEEPSGPGTEPVAPICARVSVSGQEAASVKLAESLGCRVHETEVNGTSGPEERLMREEFERMRRAAAAGEVDAVFVYGASQLSRDETGFLAALEELDGHGVAVPILVKNQHGIQTRAVRRLRQAAGALVRFALSLVGHGTRT